MAEKQHRIVGLAMWASLLIVGIGLLQISTSDWWFLVLWAAGLAVSDYVRVSTPSGGRISMVLAIAVAVIVSLDDPVSAGAVLALGLTGSRMLLRVVGARSYIGLVVHIRVVVGLAMLLAIHTMVSGSLAAFGWTGDWSQLAAIVLAGAAWLATDALIRMITAFGMGRTSMRYASLLSLADWPVVVSLVGSGALFALAWPVLSWWAVPAVGLPYMMSHIAFGRVASSRRTYRQMIVAMSQLPEVAGLNSKGHAVATADLAVSIGKRVGLHPHEVIELEYAALLHDIGRITIEEEREHALGDVASWGAAIIEEAPYLAAVADHVAQHHLPYRRPGEDGDPDVGVEARIIRLAAYYDRLVRDKHMLPLEAMEVLYRRTAYDFDPVLVGVLHKVLMRRGELARAA